MIRKRRRRKRKSKFYSLISRQSRVQTVKWSLKSNQLQCLSFKQARILSRASVSDNSVHTRQKSNQGLKKLKSRSIAVVWLTDQTMVALMDSQSHAHAVTSIAMTIWRSSSRPTPCIVVIYRLQGLRVVRLRSLLDQVRWAMSSPSPLSIIYWAMEVRASKCTMLVSSLQVRGQTNARTLRLVEASRPWISQICNTLGKASTLMSSRTTRLSLSTTVVRARMHED